MSDFLEKLLDGVEVEWVPLGEVCDVRNGYTPSKVNPEFWKDGTIPWFRMEDIRNTGRILKESIQHVTEIAVKKGKLFPANSIILSTTATIGEHALVTVDFLCNQQLTVLSLKRDSKNFVLPKYLYHYGFRIGNLCRKNTNPGGFALIGTKKIRTFKIPIPCPETPEKSLAIQAEIVRILDTFTELTAELTARKKQYNYYRDQLLTFEEGTAVTPMSIGDIYDFKYGKGNTIPTEGGSYPVYGSNGVVGTHHEYNSENSPVIGHIGAYAGIVNWGKGKHYVTYNGVICKMKSKDVLPQYAYYVLLTQDFGSKAKNSSQPFVSYNTLKEPVVLIPSLAEQACIVAILDKFDTLTHSISEGLPREIELRQKQYEYYRDLLLNFPTAEPQTETIA